MSTSRFNLGNARVDSNERDEPQTTSAGRPEVRANWTRVMLCHYDEHLPAEGSAAVQASFPADARARLMDAGPLEWLFADVHMRILRAPFPVLGEEAYRALWREIVKESLELPIFRSFARGVLSMFTSSPAQVVRAVPRAFGLVARRCGDLEAIGGSDAREMDFVWENVPALLLPDDAFVFAWAGTLDAVLDVTSTAGQVVVVSKRRRRVVYKIRW